MWRPGTQQLERAVSDGRALPDCEHFQSTAGTNRVQRRIAHVRALINAYIVEQVAAIAHGSNAGAGNPLPQRNALLLYYSPEFARQDDQHFHIKRYT